MNYNTLTPMAKVLKKLQNYTDGQPVTSKDAPIIAVVNASNVIESKRLVENVTYGIRLCDASVCVHNIPFMSYADKISPMTAKYADSFRRLVSANTQAIIKTSMADGVVVVTDDDVTAAGVIEGCCNVNCPVVILPLGKTEPDKIVSEIEKPILQIAGVVTSGKITSAKSDEIISGEDMPKRQSDLFYLLENLGFLLPGASENMRGSGKHLAAATETGKFAVKMASDLKTPRKILTKNAWQNAVDFVLTNNYNLGTLELACELFNANEIKTPHYFIAERLQKLGTGMKTAYLSGAAIGSGYIQFKERKPALFGGKAWVYQDLESADRALLSGSIPKESVVVLQNCVGVDVSAFAQAIIGMNRTNDIAIATDGVCEITDVLTVIMISPTSLDNEEFANIQNGDMLEIDAQKGRFSTNLTSKDLKTRQKRNTIKKAEVYF